LPNSSPPRRHGLMDHGADYPPWTWAGPRFAWRYETTWHLLGKLASVIELELFYHNWLGLDQCACPLDYIKRGRGTPCNQITQSNPIQGHTPNWT
jgi:hypothetical protein